MTELKDIPKEYIIGRKYHVSWAKNRGYVWKLVSFNVDTNKAVLETPNTKKQLTTELTSLRNINKFCEL
jgi:hypothetical protein